MICEDWELEVKCVNDAAGNQVLTLVDEATFYAFQRTKTILKHMGEFTLHDGDHLFRVLTLCDNLHNHIGVFYVSNIIKPILKINE